MRDHQVIVFSTRSYAAMGGEICRLKGLVPGEVERKDFSDGERYQRIVTDIAGRDVALVGGTISDADTLELFDLAGSLVRYGARNLTLAIPYFGYSTMERAGRPGEVVTAKSRACLLSSIPSAFSGNRLLLVDLHVEGITHYFEGALRPVHLSARPIVASVARRLGGKDFVMASTDAGRAKWVEALANELKVSASFIFKRRVASDRTEVIAMNADVAGRCVVIYDDMIRSGGSLIKAAEAYRAAGAKSIVAIATHGVFSQDALERLRRCGLFSNIVCTDTHPRARQMADDFLKVESIAPLIAEGLRET